MELEAGCPDSGQRRRPLLLEDRHLSSSHSGQTQKCWKQRMEPEPEPEPG